MQSNKDRKVIKCRHFSTVAHNYLNVLLFWSTKNTSGGSMGDPGLLASAIAEALVTTASGLGVYIPSIIFHNYFISRSNKMVLEMECKTTEIVLGMSNKSVTTVGV